MCVRKDDSGCVSNRVEHILRTGMVQDGANSNLRSLKLLLSLQQIEMGMISIRTDTVTTFPPSHPSPPPYALFDLLEDDFTLIVKHD